jgi:hypothetical protein
MGSWPQFFSAPMAIARGFNEALRFLAQGEAGPDLRCHDEKPATTGLCQRAGGSGPMTHAGTGSAFPLR